MPCLSLSAHFVTAPNAALIWMNGIITLTMISIVMTYGLNPAMNLKTASSRKLLKLAIFPVPKKLTHVKYQNNSAAGTSSSFNLVRSNVPSCVEGPFT